MRLKTPAFWYRDKTAAPPPAEKILTPLSHLYGFSHKINQAIHNTEKAAMPVICVGNIVAGGSGKTPVCEALMALVTEHELAKNAHFLTRGYGGVQSGPLLVDYFKHKATDIGDESLLLAKTAYTIVSADRIAGARHARLRNADLIIMDDGLQNPSLHKDISFIVIDGASGFGNGKLLPAGPLREPLNEGLKKADAFILIGRDKANVSSILPEGKPVLRAHIEVPENKKPPTTKPYLAFAGLGRPEKFYHLLKKLGYDIAGWHAYPDHYPYSMEDILELQRKAKEAKASLITTEKDLQRIPDADWPFKIATLPIKLIWENENELAGFLKEKLKSKKT